MTTEHAPTANLSLDEQQQFEKLLAEYANAEMDVVRSAGRRHNALHACIDFINKRTNTEIREAFKAGSDHGFKIPRAPMVPGLPNVPFAPPVSPTISKSLKAKALHDAEVARGERHGWQEEGTPVEGCSCKTCCELRTLRGIGKRAHIGSLQTDLHCSDEACWCRSSGPIEAPILDVSGGN